MPSVPTDSPQLPPLEPQVTAKGKIRHIKGSERKEAYAKRALNDILPWIQQL